MEDIDLKNMIILKDLPSNIVKEAYVVFKSNKMIKKFQKIKQGDTIALYQQKFKMIFEYLGKQITYQEYLGM